MISLPFEIRQKSRFRCASVQGVDIGVQLDRGTILRHGDLLTGPHGKVVQVESQPESVSIVRGLSQQDLVRVAYHLGNRHVAVQVGADWLCYLQDHVLDELCERLGLKLSHGRQPFEPESGAYHGQHSHE